MRGPKTGPQAKENIGAFHQTCGGAIRWSRNGDDTRLPASFGLRWKRLKAARRLASEHEIHANLLLAWIRQLQEDGHRVYASNALCAVTSTDHIRLDSS